MYIYVYIYRPAVYIYVECVYTRLQAKLAVCIALACLKWVVGWPLTSTGPPENCKNLRLKFVHFGSLTIAPWFPVIPYHNMYSKSAAILHGDYLGKFIKLRLPFM